MKLFFTKIINKIKNILRRTYVYINRKKYNGNQVSIISQNCIGGVFYHDMKCKFLSPTVGLFIRQPDFIKLVNNLKYYLDSDIVIEDGESYPLGRIDDITVDFMHYTSCEEAYELWNRRKARVDFNKIVVLCSDADGFDDSIFEEWKNIKYPKILFTVNEKYKTDNSSLYFKEYSDLNFLPNTIDTRKFYKHNKLMNTINNAYSE